MSCKILDWVLSSYRSNVRAKFMGLVTRAVILYSKPSYKIPINNLLINYWQCESMNVTEETEKSILDFFYYISQIIGFFKGVVSDEEFKTVYIVRYSFKYFR